MTYLELAAAVAVTLVAAALLSLAVAGFLSWVADELFGWWEHVIVLVIVIATVASVAGAFELWGV